MNDRDLYILGVGHNTATIIDLVGDCGYFITGLLHYNHDRIGENYFGHEICGCFDDFLDRESLEGMDFVLSMGDISIRKKLYERIMSKGGNIPTLVHPTATISKYTKLGNGVIVLPQSIIQGDTSIGDNTVITMHSTIAHSTIIGNHCFISGHSLIGSFVRIEDKVHIGQGSIIVSGSVEVIGENSILGAGSVLRGNMKSNAVYVGNPARFIKLRD